MPLCFDLDGTLGTFGGGYVLLREALAELWDHQPTEAELRRCAGSTDWEIVDELHRNRFGSPLSLDTYTAFEALCLTRFEATFQPQARDPVTFWGIVDGLHRLSGLGYSIWVVSGNVPKVLSFKARALGLDPALPLLGSQPGLDRAGLIRKALEGCAGPHLYVGDRPHDRAAALAVGIPFLGIGPSVPGDHPCLAADAAADHLVQAVKQLMEPPQRTRGRP